MGQPGNDLAGRQMAELLRLGHGQSGPAFRLDEDTKDE